MQNGKLSLRNLLQIRVKEKTEDGGSKSTGMCDHLHTTRHHIQEASTLQDNYYLLFIQIWGMHLKVVGSIPDEVIF
jgi:hypothetical protein